jgi:hypothetical protein
MTTAINMTDARRMIVACYEADEPLMLLGKPGMGKTSMFESVCSDLGIAFIDFRLSMRDPVDVGGMRVPDAKTGVLRHYIPEDLPDPKRHGAKGILLFDEINVVSQLLQATAYGIIQERRNGSYRMAKGWVPMASGNNVSDRAAAQRISTALANRFNVQVVEPDLPSWLDQYGSEHCDARGTAFLRFRPELFHVMPKADEIAFPSARSWTKALKFIEQEPRFRRKIFSGYVGTTAADEFEAFWRVMANVVSLKEIIADPTNARLPKEDDCGTYYAVAGMIARSMDRKNIEPLATYADRMLPDYQVAIMQDATGREPSLKNTAAYGRWAVKHQEVTL